MSASTLLTRPGTWLRELGAAAALGLVLLALATWAPSFFEPGNLRDLAIANAPLLIIAVGMTFVLVTGHVDVSVGSLLAVCSVAAALLARAGVPMPLVVLLTVGIGSGVGAINGWCVARLGAPSVVVTLAMLVILRDGLRWTTEGMWVQGLPRTFQWLGLRQASGEGLIVLIAVAVLAVAAFAGHNLPAGRAVYAVGSDPEAARLTGLSPSAVVFGVFVLIGACTGLAAVLNAVRFSAVQPNVGLGLEMRILAAVVVGGTLVTGGRGTMIGTLIGVALLGVLATALTFLGVNPFWEKAIQGAIILAASSADALSGLTLRRRSRAIGLQPD